MVRQSSAKQARFVREYAVDCNGAAAAVRAGYSPRSAKVTASRLLTKANVQRALQQIQQVDAERLALSREAVIDQLQDAIELARVKQDPMAMIVGLRELGRMMGYYGRRVSDIECGCREFREDGEFVFDAGR